jgi:hypothetical protein
MTNINDLHGKKAYIEAYRREGSSNLVQQRADLAKRRRERIAHVCIMFALVAIITICIASATYWWITTPWDSIPVTR